MGMMMLLRLMKRLSAIKSIWLVIVLPAFLLAVLFFAMTLNHIYVQTYDDIEVFDRAKETIRSPITVENEKETERKMRETVLAVGDRYTTLDEITEERLKYVNEIFDAVNNVKNNEQYFSGEEQLVSNEELLLQLRELLSKETAEHLDDIFFLKLIQIDDDERERAKTVFLNGLQPILENGVRIENLQTAREELSSIIKYSTLHNDVKDVLYELVDFAVVENAIFDVEKTMEARKEAANSVQPVIIRSGDIIVREGQIITNEIYEELELVGLINSERKMLPAIGLAILILFISALITYELFRLYRKGTIDLKQVSAIVIINIIVITMMKVFSFFVDQVAYLYAIVPIATGVLLIKLLVFERLSMIFALIFSILGSILFNGYIPGSLNVEAGIYFLIFQLAAVTSLTNVKDRTALLKTALITSFINVMTIGMFIFLSFEKFNWFEALISGAFGVGAAMLSVVLTIGLLPFFETSFGILSDGKLLSLANPNHPLLKKILTEAPGTYHHSVMVANLSESACEAIGANGLLARVASYYHDIGKTLKPHYFIENQVGIKNPHDFIDPIESAKIIIEHVTEGAKMLEAHHFPEEIIDITLQHHGTSRVEYFYRLEKGKNEHVNEADFRYPGPKPQTKEAGIVSICDATEATVRSLTNPSPEKIEEIVANIIRDKLIDGQLDETPLTFHELTIIRKSICNSLKGIFHSRIQYPQKEEA